MSTKKDFEYRPAELVACIKAWNQSAKMTGLDTIDLHQVVAGNDWRPSSLAMGLLAGRGLETI